LNHDAWNTSSSAVVPGYSSRACAPGDEPTVAADRYGGVYVAWQENRDGSDTDVFFARAQ
jgi:hypothetical protein